MMTTTNPKTGWPVAFRSKKNQRGQALIYGLFVLIGGLAALFFLFNTGQLAREKTKLVNTTDAVAYSGGVMNARALNYQAYVNRAMMANTIAIAQLVSLSSWVEYADSYGSFGVVPAATDQNTGKYFFTVFLSQLTASTLGATLQSTLNNSGNSSSGLQGLASASDRIIRTVLMNAQQVVYGGLVVARSQVMTQVAQANYRNDGAIAVDLVPLTINEFTSFTSRYSDNERTRFAEVSRVSANRDTFVPSRSWRLPGWFSNCTSAMLQGRFDWMSRRGGTNLIGFDEWKAVDSLSEFTWVPKNKTDVLCQGLSEGPAGFGGRSAADNPSASFDPSNFDFAVPTNPASGGLGFASASTNSWGYSGLPNFYDLSQSALSQDDPKMTMAIRVRRDKSETQTSEARSRITGSARLNNYQAQMAGGNQMAAVSASEVFFQRDGVIRDNSYGAESGRPREIGSLFNPYWQVRLVQSDADVRKAQLLQGITLP